MKKLSYRIDVCNKTLNFNELEFLIFTSFILRLKKEYEWNRVKNKSFFIASNNYTFLRAMVDENIIYLSVRDDSFCLTSEEMIELYGNVINSLFSYYPIDGLDYSNIDGVFFEHMLAVDLPFLKSVTDELVSIDNLSIFSNNKEIVSIKNSEHYQMLTRAVLFDIKTRTNLHNQSHEERFELIKKQLTEFPYGTTGENIVLYNNDNIIRDGAHRAAVLYTKSSEQMIKVKRYMFTFNYYSFTGCYKKHIQELSFSSLLTETRNNRWDYVNGKKITIIRSDGLINYNIDDLNKLKSNNINTIIDLRVFGDREKPQFLIDNFNYYNVPIIHTNKATKEETALFVKNTPEYYLFLLSQKNKIKEVFDIILHSQGNFLIFCMAGRDRTGVVSLLCELLAESSMEEVVEEYALTDAIYERINDDKYKDFSYINAKKNICDFLDLFFKKFDNISNYFYQLGYTQGEINIICSKIKGWLDI